LVLVLISDLLFLVPEAVNWLLSRGIRPKVHAPKWIAYLSLDDGPTKSLHSNFLAISEILDGVVESKRERAPCVLEAIASNEAQQDL
jgi:hypothetical protein